MSGSSALARRLSRAREGVILLALVACTQPPVTSSVMIPPIPAGGARIWVYRDYEPYAGKGLPAVFANSGYVGAAELGGAFYRDLPPGRYQVTVETNGRDFNQAAEVDLPAGREAYVKIVSLPSWVSGGLNLYERPTFYAWLIPSDTARGDVARLAFRD